MQTSPERTNLFTERAKAAAAVVKPVSTVHQAFDYALQLCARNRRETPPQTSPPAIAAPALAPGEFALLEDLGASAQVRTIRDGLRGHLRGVDVAITYADFGIADTGTIVINSTDEDLRLATMISDVHVAILPVSCIHQDSLSLRSELLAFLAGSGNYTAFITGPSRTADIERVLAIGVHGPLELHILLLEETQC